ncbi:MAG: HNH endonuclease, partial [Cyanobium sp.]
VASSTERDALTKARLGHGLFRHRVAEREPACRVTGLARQQFLVASHIKPWRDCDNRERLDGANGLLLSPPCGQTVRPPLDQLRCRRATDL